MRLRRMWSSIMNRKTTIDEKVSHGSLDENQAMSLKAPWRFILRIVFELGGQVFFLVFCLLYCTTTKVSEWWRCSIFCMKKCIHSYPTYYILWQKSLNEKRNLYMYWLKIRLGTFRWPFLLLVLPMLLIFADQVNSTGPIPPSETGISPSAEMV